MRQGEITKGKRWACSLLFLIIILLGWPQAVVKAEPPDTTASPKGFSFVGEAYGSESLPAFFYGTRECGLIWGGSRNLFSDSLGYSKTDFSISSTRQCEIQGIPVRCSLKGIDQGKGSGHLGSLARIDSEFLHWKVAYSPSLTPSSSDAYEKGARTSESSSSIQVTLLLLGCGLLGIVTIGRRNRIGVR